MKFKLEEYHRNVPNDELINDLKRVAKSLGKDKVTIEEYNEKGKYHSTTLTRRFGSWFVCLEKAGLKPTRTPLNIPNEDLFMNLEEVWRKLGRQPRYKEMNDKSLSKYSAGTYEKRFGTWRKTLESFIEYVNERFNKEKQVDIYKGNKKSLKGKERKNLHKTKRKINWRLRFLVMKRDNFKCSLCGKSPATDPSVVLEVDHKIPYSKGGETVFENLQTLCRECNRGKSNL